MGRMRKAREDNVKEINESLMRASPIGHPLSPKRKAMSDDVSGKEEQYIERMYLMPMRKKYAHNLLGSREARTQSLQKKKAP